MISAASARASRIAAELDIGQNKSKVSDQEVRVRGDDSLENSGGLLVTAHQIVASF